MCDFWVQFGPRLLRIELKINEIEASYSTIHKVYFIFYGPSNLGARRTTRRGPGTPLRIGVGLHAFI